MKQSNLPFVNHAICALVGAGVTNGTKSEPLFRFLIQHTTSKLAGVVAMAILSCLFCGSAFAQDIGELSRQLDQLNQTGQFQQAVPLAREIVRLRKKNAKVDPAAYARSVSNLAILWSKAGHDADAEPVYRDAIGIWKEVFAGKHSANSPNLNAPGSLEVEAKVYGGCLNNLGEIYKKGGRYADAEPLFRKAMEIWKEAFGEKSPFCAISLNNLAETYQKMAAENEKMGRYGDAESMLQKAMGVEKELTGDKSLGYADSLNRLANLYGKMSRDADAEPLLRDAIQIRKELLEAAPPGTAPNPDRRRDPIKEKVRYAASLANLAVIYEKGGRFAEAEPLYRDALQSFKEALGDKHPDYATSVDNLATLYVKMNRNAEAESLYREALQILKETPGEKSPSYGSSLQRLATLYVKMGRNAEAEPLLQEALRILKEASEEKNPDYVTSLHNLSALYDRMGRYGEAEPLLQEALRILKETSGEKTHNYALNLSSLATLYKKQDRYADAEPLLRDAIRIWKAIPNAKDADYVASLDSLGELYGEMARYSDAEPLLREAVQLRKELVGAKHHDYAASLDNLSTLYRKMHRYADAEPLLKEAIRILKEGPGEHTRDYAGCLNNLGLLYDDMSRYGEAEPLLRDAVRLIKEVAGEKSPYYAECLGCLGVLYVKMDRHAEAEPLLREALRVRKASGEKGLRYALDLNDLAVLSKDLGRYGDAEALSREAMQIQKENKMEGSPDYAESLHNLSALYAVTDRYGEAEPLLQEAIQIMKKAFGEKSPDYARSLSNLGVLYDEMGRYSEAEPLLRKAIQITMVARDLDYATNLVDLAIVYRNTGRGEAAEPLLQDALRIKKDILGDKSPSYAGSLDDLATIYFDDGRYGVAEPLFQEAMEIRKMTLGEKHPDYAKSLNNLGAVYVGMGRYGDAEPLLKEAMRIWSETLPEGHQNRARVLDTLGWLNTELGRSDVALTYLVQCRRQRETELGRIFSFTGEADRLAWMSTFDPFSRAGILGNGPELAACALRFKGIVLDSVAEDREALAIQGDAKTRALVIELNGIRADLREAALEGGRGKLSEQDYKNKTERVAEIERQLARVVAGYGTARRSLSSGLADVQAVLSRGAALVEMVAYWHYPSVAIKKTDSNAKPERRYAAALIRRDGQPVFVDLGAKAGIDDELDKVRARIAHITDLENKGQQRALEVMEAAKEDKLRQPCQALYRLLIDPIEKALAGEKVTTLIFSPDGQLNFVPFAALVDANGHYLCQRYEVRLISTGRDLLREREQLPDRGKHVQASSSAGAVVLIGNPNLKDESPRLALEKSESRDRLLSGQTTPAIAMNRNLLGNGLDHLGNSGDDDPFLMGAEVDALEMLFGEKGQKAVKKKGKEATEVLLRSLQGPRVLHLATHGFFLREEKNVTDNSPGGGNRLLVPSGQSGALGRLASSSTNPMLRAGLELAGAQTTLDLWVHNQIPPPNEDGVLMAAEVAELNLHGTDLVVLSACETAQGEPKDGEGVLGLRRAFATAGARNLLLTLWPINGQVTNETMKAFYRRILAGEDPPTALSQIQSEYLPMWQNKVGFDLAVRYVAPFVLTSMGKPAEGDKK